MQAVLHVFMGEGFVSGSDSGNISLRSFYM